MECAVVAVILDAVLDSSLVLSSSLIFVSGLRAKSLEMRSMSPLALVRTKYVKTCSQHHFWNSQLGLSVNRTIYPATDNRHPTLTLQISSFSFRRHQASEVKGRRTMLSTVRFRGHLLTSRAAAPAIRPADVLIQFFSGKSDDDDDFNKTIPFRPRRRSSPEYRPLSPRKVKTRGPIDPNTNPTYLDNIVLGENDEGKDELESAFGPYAADAIRHSRQKRSQNIESSLRMADFMTARPGTTEHLVGERRAMMDLWDNEDREEFMTGLDRLVEEERVRSMELGDDDMEPPHETDLKEDEEADPNQLVHGDW